MTGSGPEEPPLGSRTVSLALQGGASLGAYTWGVLDALLEDGRLEFEGVTGSSAGAINAAALGVGLALGGRAGARERLRAFWEGLARAAESRRRNPFDFTLALLRYLPRIRSKGAFYALTTRLVTNFHMDVKTMEPLRSTLNATLDFSALDRTERIKVFVNATDVMTGQPEVFSGSQIDAQTICASCAHPLLFEPVPIGERWYWDGALVGNPAIYPVILGCRTSDVVLVETLPSSVDGPPRTPADVMGRTLDLASTSGLIRELRAIALVNALARESPGPQHREIRLHRVPSHEGLSQVGGKRGFRADIPYFRELCELGRRAGRSWLAAKLPDALTAAPGPGKEYGA